MSNLLGNTQQFSGLVAGSTQAAGTRGQVTKHLVDVDGRLVAVAESDAKAAEPRWLDLSAYVGCSIRIEGEQEGDVIYGARVSVERLPDQASIDTLTVVTGEDVTFSTQPSGAVEINGTFAKGESGAFTKGSEAVVLGFNGRISVPRGFRVTLCTGIPDIRTDVLNRFAPSLAGRGTPLPAAPQQVTSVKDMMALVDHATFAKDKDFFFGAYPEGDPHVLAYLNKIAEAKAFHAMHRERRRRREAEGISRRDDWDQIGDWLTESISKSGEVRAMKDQYWEASRAAIRSDIGKLVAVARSYKDYQYRYDAQAAIAADTLKTLREGVQGEYEAAHADGWFDGLRLCTAGLLGSAVIIGGITYGAVQRVETAQMARVAVPGFLATALGAALAGVAWTTASDDKRARRAKGAQKVYRQLMEIQHLEEAQEVIEREGVHHRVVGEVLTILSETHEELKKELQLMGPADAARKRRAHDRAKYHIELRIEELSGWREPADAFVKALLAGDSQQCGTMLVSQCIRANASFRPVKAGSDARTDRLIKGFVGLNLAGTDGDPDALWQ